MKFISTRKSLAVGIEDAIMSGTAPDGGLYVPELLPERHIDEFRSADSFHEIAALWLQPFFADSVLEPELAAICSDALNFPIPVTSLEQGDTPLSVLELFHGPTAAFKDVGARFLAATMVRIIESGKSCSASITIIVATSGDTGAAVAAAFHRRPGVRVVVLLPDGRVSPRQQHQRTCWGDNIISLAVSGEFDDCQRLAKEAFADCKLNEAHHLCSANSINVGRLLPQSAYYAAASIRHFRATGEKTSFVIPTGNLGNGLACVWARRMGMPIGDIVFATNANTTIPDYLLNGEWVPRSSVATLASAMDVGDPSNMERLQLLNTDVDQMRQEFSAVTVSDETIKATIADEYQRHEIAWCPHTATGFHAYRMLPESRRRNNHWVVVATAHAAKFDTIVEPLLGTSIAAPAELAELLTWPSQYETISASLDEIASRL